MNTLVEKFLERPKSQKIAFWIASLTLLTFLYWQYFYAGKNKELVELTEKRDSLSTQIAHERRLAQSLPAYRRDIKALEGKLNSALKQLPNKREIPGLLSAIATLAKDAGLQVFRFAPRPDVLMNFYAAVPADLEVRGTYHQIATLFDEIADLTRVVNITDVMMKNPKGVEEESSTEIEGKCSVTTFRYLEEDERTQVEQSQDDVKKRRKKVVKKTTGGEEE